MLISGAVVSQAQYVGRVDTAKAEKAQTLRATAVLEYTGDYTKPIASRLIPLAVWDGTTYQPAGLYLAQPVPLAVESGTQYQLEESGLAKGFFDVKAAANIGGPGGSWVAIGGYQKPISPAQARLKASKHIPKIDGWGDDDDQPHFAHRPSDSSNGSSKDSGNAPAKDPDRPTLNRRTGDNSSSSSPDSGTGSSSSSGTGNSTSGNNSGSTSSGSGSSSDPDRPTLHRKTEDSGSSSGGSSTGSSGSGTTAGSGTGPVDPDRPTMHRRTPSSGDGSPVTATTDIDPNRPRLRHGRPEEQEKLDVPSDVEIAKLSGHPENLEQMVAVSDVATHSSENWRYSWADPADAKSLQTQLEGMAQNLFAGKPMVAPIGGGFGSGTTASSTTSGAAAKSSAVTGTHTTAIRNAHRKAALSSLPVLADEQFHAYALTFGGGATLVFSAKTTLADGKVKYVTLIAQPDFSGQARVLFHQMTSDDQLDQTPRMLVVDALDTDGDGRAELIFELAGRTDRQYAIYRVGNGEVEQVFSTAGAS
ncbi:hypothetical protein GCM10011586_18080 [Silvibacterium dinghuense]|nr:hypothetical protein GCM10011586_18080 [Silvibacterium dinghuense]